MRMEEVEMVGNVGFKGGVRSRASTIGSLSGHWTTQGERAGSASGTGSIGHWLRSKANARSAALAPLT